MERIAQFSAFAKFAVTSQINVGNQTQYAPDLTITDITFKREQKEVAQQKCAAEPAVDAHYANRSCGGLNAVKVGSTGRDGREANDRLYEKTRQEQ